MGKTRNAVKILGGNPEDYLGNPGVHRRIILKLKLMKQRGVYVDWIYLVLCKGHYRVL
jgi:hypothetical protein